MLLSATHVAAEVLIDFNFTGNAGDEATVAPASVATGLTIAAPLSRGSGTKGAAATQEKDGYGMRFNVTATSEEQAVSRAVYAAFSFRVNSGFAASLSALDFGWRYQDGQPNRRIFALASVDGGQTGFTADEIVASTNAAPTTSARYALDLSQCGRLQNIPSGTLVEIRIYHCNGNPSIYQGEALTSQGSYPGLDLLGTVGAAGGAPTVAIETPLNNTHFPYGNWPAAIPISTLAVADGGEVAEVSFYCGDSLIGATNEAPFEINWQWEPAQGAEYLLKAVALDESGNAGTSDVVRVTAGFDLPPLVSVVSPAHNAFVPHAGSMAAMLVSVDARDDSAVTNVEFFVDGETLGSVAREPFELHWTPPSTGVYRFSAIATDDIAQTTLSSTNFVEILDKQQSALLAFENFASAPATSALHLKNTGAGWTNAWQIQNGDANIPGYNISDAEPLSYPNLKSDPQHATGGRVHHECKRRLDFSAAGPFADYLVSGRIRAPGKTLWVSYMVRNDNNANASSRFGLIKYDNSAMGGLSILRVANENFSWNFSQLTNQNNTAQSANLGAPVVARETALFVIRVDFGIDGLNHSASCWANPAPDTLGAASAPPPDATFAIEDNDFWFDGVNWYPSSDPGHASFDELRIGRTWASVTPPILPCGTLLILR
jgi:hypothetical protein